MPFLAESLVALSLPQRVSLEVHPRHVYVHVPFCARRCSYCDFAIAVRRITPVEDYIGGLEAELSLRAGDSQTDPVSTIYLGGGTPSRLGIDGVARVVDLVRRHFPPGADAELTLEANPDDVDVESVRAWRAAGINRVSLGVQSFDDGVLAWMHRTHTADGAQRAAEALAAGGISNWSIDLIFALPEALGRSWERDLEAALELGPAHVSLYGLTVEASTPIARWRDRGAVVAGDEESYEREFLHAHRELAARGFDHYEVSNFGRSGQWSRHNRGYWRGAPYVGLGPGAHGYDGGVRSWNQREYVQWLAAVRSGVSPEAGRERLTAENRVAEQVYLGLRTLDGLELEAPEVSLVEPWIGAGWAVLSGRTLRLTPTGWLRLDALAASLTALRSR